MASADETYRSLFENAVEGMYRTTPEGRFVAANGALAKILGYPSVEDLLAGTSDIGGQHYVNPADRDEFIRKLEACEGMCPTETELRRRDGAKVWVRLTSRAVREPGGEVRYYEGTMEDITERKRAEQHREHLASFPQLNPHPVIEVDVAGRLTYCNPAAREQFPDLGEEGWDHPLLRDLETVLPQLRETDDPDKVAATHIDVPYQDRVYELHVSYVRARERVRVYIVEITDRRHAEIALRRAKERLERTLGELQDTQQQVIQQERLGALGTMASGIAHDFNNALMPIVGFTDLLLQRPENLADPEKATRYLQTISTAAKDAGEVVNRMREFYRNRDEGDVYGLLDVNELVEQATALTEPKWKGQAQAENVHIAVEQDLGDVPQVSANGPQIREVLTNLIFNAVDAIRQKAKEERTDSAEPSRGVITLRTTTECRHDGEDDGPESGDGNDAAHVVIEVADSGCGMTEETRRRCLEPFFTTKGDAGTGMGLSVVFGIVRRHGGRVAIDSAPGEGTTFRLSLPVTQPGVEPGDHDQTTEQAQRALRIVAVDDEPHTRELLCEYLSGDGHTVETASDGRQGLQLFLKDSYDLLITDRAMPELSGDQLAAAVKSVSPQTPVIMLTGFGELMKSASERPDGVDLLLGKPLTLESLRQAIAKVVGGAG